MTREYDSGTETLLAEYLYTLRADGLRVRADETDANGTTTFDWVYDELGRLTEEAYDGPGTDDDYVARYGFDLASNRVRKEVDLGSDTTIDEVITYFHDENDRLTREERDDQTPTGADTTTFYDYDATEQISKKEYAGLHTSEPIGNPDATTTYEYNLQGRLEKVTVDDGTSVTVTDYLYNDVGARIQKTVQVDQGVAVVTQYHIDPQNHTGYAKAIEEIVDGQLERSYAIGHAIISQALADGTLFQLLHDGHGSTRALLNPVNGQIVERYAYDAYGATLAGTGLTSAALAQTTWLFAGDGQFDPASGLTNHIARWRSGGRFLTLDPFQGNPQDPLSLHKYLYTHGNPVMGTDPSGLVSLGEMNVVSSISNFLATASKVYSGYRRARNVLDFIDIASTILQIATGDLTQLFREVKRHIKSVDFGTHAGVFSRRGIERGLQALLANGPLIIANVLSQPAKMQELAGAIAGPKPTFVIGLPTPPLAIPLASIPPIQVGHKLGRLRFPVFLSFAEAKHRGRFIGFAIAASHRARRFDNNAHFVFHMDYVVYHTLGEATPDLALWHSADGKFEFQIPEVRT